MKYIDIHSHVNLPQFDVDREEVFARAAAAEVGMIIVGTDIESSVRAVALAHGHDNVWAIVGIHPTETSVGVDFDTLKKIAHDPKVVAIGECGLDYVHSTPEEITQQKELFIQHILLANEIGKPLMLHVRNGKEMKGAYQEALDILKTHAKVRFNFHFFAGTQQDAADIIALNGTISFTGVLTFTEDYDVVIRSAPLTHIMSETDCPFVAPVPYRGKRNEPVYVIEVVKAIARIRKEEEEEVRIQLLENARNFFNP
jgi:TatD DNase family protein